MSGKKQIETPGQVVARLLEAGVGQNVLSRWLKGRKGDKTKEPDVTLGTALEVFRALGDPQAWAALLDAAEE